MKKTFLVCLLAICMLFTACSGEGSRGNAERKPENPVTVGTNGDVEGGIHEYKITPTGKNIIENGSTDYQILIPADADEYEILAAKELEIFIGEATGVTLTTVKEAEEGGKYFSLGDTELAKSSEITTTHEKVGYRGFIIETKDENIFIMGAESKGTLYGVYGYLEQELSFDWFYTSVYHIDSVEVLPLNNYSAIDVPDIEYRMPGYGYMSLSKDNMNRMRFDDGNDLFIPVNGKQWHNSFEYFPKDKYQSEHPKIYAEDKSQLCYTAHGDADELKWMAKTAAEVIKKRFTEVTDKNLITLSIEDTMTSCTCETCTKEKEKYGTDAAAIVKLLNLVAQNVSEWMAGEGKPYERDYRLLFFAYHQTNAAPIGDDIVLDKHVVPYFAETNGDYTQNFYDKDTANEEVAYNMKKWSEISPELYFWNYDTNFSNYLIPYNSFGAIQDIYKFAFEVETDFIYTQSQYNQENSTTGFGLLKGYLESKLGWNVNVDVDALTDKFFDAMYGDAADTVQQVYEEYRVLAQYQTDKLGYKGSRSIFMNGLQTKFWPRSSLFRWINMLYQALDEIEAIKLSEPAEYQKISKNIENELISFLYLYVEMYENITEVETVDFYKKEFKRIVEKIGLSQYAERNAPLSNIYTSWGIN